MTDELSIKGKLMFLLGEFKKAGSGKLRSILFIVYFILIFTYPLVTTAIGIGLFTFATLTYVVYIIWDDDGRSRFCNGVKDKKSITTMSFLLITVWTLLSTIWSLSWMDTIGIAFLFIFLFFLFIAIKYEFNADSEREGLYYAFFLGIFIVMGYLLFQNVETLLQHGSFIRGFHLSTIENANSMSAIAMMGFFAAFSKARESRNWSEKIFFIILTFLCLFAIVTCQSRAALGIMLIGLVILVTMYNKRFLWLLLIFVIIIAMMPSVQQRFLDIFSYEQNVPRVKIWLVAVRLFEMNPITGTGASAFRFGYTEFFNTNPQLFNDWDIKGIWHAHNMFLRFLAELGLPGLVGITGVLIGAFRSLIKLKNSTAYKLSQRKFVQGIFIALVTFTMANLVDSYFMEPKVMIIFYILIGISQSFSQKNGIPS